MKEGIKQGYLFVGFKMLDNDYPPDSLAELMEIPEDELKTEYEKYKIKKLEDVA